MTMRYIRLFLLLCAIFIFYPSFSQLEVDDCVDGETTSTVLLDQVKVRGFSVDGTAVVDRATIDVPSFVSCLSSNVELDVDAGVHFSFTVTDPNVQSFAYMVVADWDGNGSYDLTENNSELIYRTTSESNEVEGSFLIPYDQVMDDFDVPIRIIIAEEIGDLPTASNPTPNNPSNTHSLQFAMTHNRPKVTVSKDANSSGGYEYFPGKRPCYLFAQHDEIDFYVINTSFTNIDVAIEQIEFSVDNFASSYRLVFNSNEGQLFKYNGTSSAAYSPGDIFLMDNNANFRKRFALQWQTILEQLPPSLRNFPISPQILEIKISLKVDGILTDFPAFTIGCCEENPQIINKNTRINFYTSSTTTIEVLANSSNNILKSNETVFLRSDEAIIFEQGVLIPQNALLYAEVISTCPNVPQIRAEDLPLAIDSENKNDDVSSDTLKNTNQINIFPNPFATETTLIYELNKRSQVKISLYNPSGQVFQILQNIVQPAGEYELTLATETLPAGLYLCTVEIDRDIQYFKIVKQ